MKIYIILYCVMNSNTQQVYHTSYTTCKEAEADAKELRMADCHHIKIVSSNLQIK